MVKMKGNAERYKIAIKIRKQKKNGPNETQMVEENLIAKRNVPFCVWSFLSI